MDKLEQFITQSKINHLKRLGICPNDDEGYQELLHQIEQKKEEIDKERKQLRRNYDTLCLINEKISFLENDEEYQKLREKYRQMKELIEQFDESDTWRATWLDIWNYCKILNLNEKDLDEDIDIIQMQKDLSKRIEPIKKRIKEKEKEEEILNDYIFNLIKIEKGERYHFELEFKQVHSLDYGSDDYYEHCLESELKEISEKIEDLKSNNDKLKDQFFTIIQEKGHLLHIKNDDEEKIDLNKFFINEYKPTNWEQYYKFDLDIKQIEEKKKNYTNEWGHWYLNGKKIVLDISDEEYEKLCKISPPFLFRIEECIQEVYNKGYNEGHEDGYNEGHEDGYNEGYNNGYDDGYRMGD